MTDFKTAKRCADALAGFAEPNRIRIIDVLRDGPRIVGQIATALGLPFVNTSHHLKILRKAGLVASLKEGRTVTYSLHPSFKKGTTIDLGWCRVEIIV